MDVLSSEQRSYCMSQIRGKNTKPEKVLAHLLNSLGLSFSTHVQLPGRPDIAFSKIKLVVFVDGCFWHSCPLHSSSPKTNANFWQAKLKENTRRDLKNNSWLRRNGWSVTRIWEHDVKRDPFKVAMKIFNKVMLKEDNGRF